MKLRRGLKHYIDTAAAVVSIPTQLVAKLDVLQVFTIGFRHGPDGCRR